MIACDIESFFTTVVSITMSDTQLKSKQLSLLKFTGADAPAFLQGQLTNDINKLDSNWQYSGYCSPKGRLLALFMLWKHNDELYGLLPSSLVEATSKRLRMYVMRSKVTIEVIDNIHISYSLTSTKQRFECKHSDNEIVLGFGQRDLLLNLNSNQTNNTVDQKWLSLNIKDGLPEITDKSAELFVPQMINLDLLGGIDFKKGCYTGQEIVARMHYLGKLKQRMFICTLNRQADDKPLLTDFTGLKVMSADKNAGHILCNQDNQALAVLRTEYTEKSVHAGLTIESLDGKKIGLSINNTQPYSLELKS